MLVAEGLSSLLFPFSWPHAYVPILPLPLIKFLEAPFPFLMGIHYRNQADKSKLSLLCEVGSMHMLLFTDQKLTYIIERVEAISYFNHGLLIAF